MSRSPSHRRHARALRQQQLTAPVASVISPVALARLRALRARPHVAAEPRVIDAEDSHRKDRNDHA